MRRAFACLPRAKPASPVVLFQRASMSTSSAAPSSASSSAVDSLQLDDLKRIIAEQDVLLKQRRADGAPADEIKAVAAHVIALRARRDELMGVATKKDKNAGKKTQYTLKTPKGTKDWLPADMLLRQHIFSTISRVFELHGGVTIDTPVFELKEILAGKYGEDSKLIYDLQDQGGELCSLRYDLTVPFARFLAMHGNQFPSIKRYHIAKVYRRDQPVMTKGRMREFYQCDFDIAGTFDPMLPDAEILAIVCEIFTRLDVGEFTVKVNHRKLLDGMFAVCGVPADKTRAISAAVDKLDKSPWAEVKKEMVEVKGLDPEVADRIGEYVKLKGGEGLVEQLQADAKLMKNKSAVEGLGDMALLFKYLHIYGCVSRISFDLSLARGLDYYTGIITETVTEGSAPPVPSSSSEQPAPTASTSSASAPPKPKKKAAATAGSEEPEVDETTVGVGSIAGGGRYDELVAMFAASARDRIPCVGVSFGVERIFSILKARERDSTGERRSKTTEAYLISAGDGMLEERMQVAKSLWDAGIKTEFMYKTRPKFPAQFAIVDKDRIPFAIIIAPDEWQKGTVRVKEQVGKEENVAKDGEDSKGVEVRRDELTAWLLEKLGRS